MHEQTPDRFFSGCTTETHEETLDTLFQAVQLITGTNVIDVLRLYN